MRNGIGGERRLAIAATSFGFALVQLEVSIVNVALAHIGQSIGAGMVGLQWVVDAYTIAFASLLLGGGALGDRLGARRTYVSGLALFALAALGCGGAPGLVALIAARAVQGAAAALLVPCSLALLTHACGDDAAARARAISWWTAAASVTLSAGPLLGGALVTTLGWRSIFLVNVPISAVAIWLTVRVVDETPPRVGKVDPLGQALAVLTLLSLIATVIEAGRSGMPTSIVLVGIVATAVGFGGFVAVEAHSRDPILPLSLFRNPIFSAMTVIGFIVNLTLYGSIFVLGLYLQQVLGYSTIGAGLAFLPLPVALGIANVASGRLGAQFGPRVPMAAGLLIGGLGYCLLGHLTATSAYGTLAPGLVVIPVGVGLAVPLMTATLLATVPRDRAGAAAGVLNAVRQAAGGIGVALFGAMMAERGMGGIRGALLLSAALLICGAAVAAVSLRLRGPGRVSGAAGGDGQPEWRDHHRAAQLSSSIHR